MCHRLTIQLCLCLSYNIYQRFPVSQQSWKPAVFCTLLADVSSKQCPNGGSGKWGRWGPSSLQSTRNLQKSKQKQYTVHSPLQLPDQAESCGDSGILPLPTFSHTGLCWHIIIAFPYSLFHQLLPSKLWEKSSPFGHISPWLPPFAAQSPLAADLLLSYFYPGFRL